MTTQFTKLIKYDNVNEMSFFKAQFDKSQSLILLWDRINDNGIINLLVYLISVDYNIQFQENKFNSIEGFRKNRSKFMDFPI